MKSVTYLFAIFLLISGAWANTGTAEIDEAYLEDLNDKVETIDSAPTRTEVTREKMEENPRNPAMVNSFESLDDAENQPKQKLKKRP